MQATVYHKFSKSSSPIIPGRLWKPHTQAIVVFNLFNVKQKHTVMVRAGTAGGSKTQQVTSPRTFCPHWHQTHSSGFSDRWSVVEAMWR